MQYNRLKNSRVVEKVKIQNPTPSSLAPNFFFCTHLHFLREPFPFLLLFHFYLLAFLDPCLFVYRTLLFLFSPFPPPPLSTLPHFFSQKEFSCTLNLSLTKHPKTN